MTQAIRTIRIATQGPAGPAGLYPQASWDAGSVPYARSSVLAHAGGVWLALRATSVEPSASVPDDWISWLDFNGMVSGFATLGEDGKIPAAQLPAIAITDTFEAASQAAMLALSAQTGDIAIRSDLSKSFVLAAADPSVLANWKELLTPTDAVLSVAGRTGAVTLGAGDVSGLDYFATGTDAANLSGTVASGRISGSYTGIVGVGTLAAGVWHATNIGVGYGGTNADLSATGGPNQVVKQATVGGAFTVGLPQIYVAAASSTAVSHTGDTNEFTLATIGVPAIPAGAQLRLTTQWSFSGAGGTRTAKAYYGATGSGAGGTLYLNAAGLAATINSARFQQQILNRTTSSQAGHAAAALPFSTSTGTIVTSSVATTVATEITITGTVANSGDTVTLEGYLLEVILP